MNKADKFVSYFYWTIFAVGIIFLAVFMLLANMSLNESNVQAASRHFNQYKNIVSYATPIIFTLMLLLSSYLYIRKGHWFYYPLSFLFFSAFTIFDWFILTEKHFAFKKENGLWDGSFSIGYVLGSMILLFGFALSGILFFLSKKWWNRRLVKRMERDLNKEI